MSWAKTVLAAGLVALAAAVGACREEAPPPAGPAATVRVVSLSPAISRALADLAPDLEVVGRTRYCRAVDPSVPIVGDLLDLDYEQLVRIDPTHVLVQPAGGRVDDHLAELAERRGWRVAGWQIDTIDDIREMVRTMPDVLFPGDAARRGELAERATSLLEALDSALTADGAGVYRGRVLLIHSVDPVGVFGAGTYLADVLDRLGGVNAAVTRGWAELTLEDVVVLDPDAIVLVAEQDADPIDAAGPLAELEIDAVRDGRLAVLADRDALLPSTSVIGVARRLHSILRTFGAER